MNIKEAKEQIKNAMTVYFTKDDNGDYIIPPERQRPVFLLGAPGIGKTAIMEQIASELNVGLVAYSMTHHTRQSAIGLPFIEKKMYDGKAYNVSEYTMSEIIASVYEKIEESQKREGILFLDEINCVSETLAPAMLQFLQYKVFGKHKVPDGWLVVTAGNPPEYNKSVREFDFVTWDRLKRVVVEPDFKIWKEYALVKGVHPSILTYLQTSKEHFYVIETTVDGKRFVTARGWTDLSEMLHLYEQHNIPVDGKLIEQYVQHPTIAEKFGMYYELFKKYESDYKIEAILSGEDTEETKEIRRRAKRGDRDEWYAVLGLIIDCLNGDFREIFAMQGLESVLAASAKRVGAQLQEGMDIITALDIEIQDLNTKIEQGKAAQSMSKEQIQTHKAAIKVLSDIKGQAAMNPPQDLTSALEMKDTALVALRGEIKEFAQNLVQKINHAYAFMEEVYSEEQLSYFSTELTIDPRSIIFLSRYRCDKYLQHSRKLNTRGRQKEIADEVNNLWNNNNGGNNG